MKSRTWINWLTPLVPQGWFKKALPNEVDLSIGVKMGWILGGTPKAFTDLLEARCARRPLAVLLDEAHNLDPEVGQVLLNASQKVRDKAPFLLVMAGTPGLSEESQQHGLHVLEPL